jgi:hypothetical protein
VGFRFPMFFSGVADVCEWYDDATARFNIEVNVHNRIWGPLFGYNGSFEVEWKPTKESEIPSHAKPYREEKRE